MRDVFRPEEIENLLSAFHEMKAENDNYLRTKFQEIFVHTTVYSDAQLSGKSLLIGGKGSGKSAILYAHEVENKDSYASVASVTLDDLPFTGIFNFFYSSYSRSLSKLDANRSEITDLIEIEKVTCYAWRNALLAVVLLSAASSLVDSHELSDSELTIVRKIKTTLEDKVGASIHKNDLGKTSPTIYAFLFLFFTFLQEQIESVISKDGPNLAALFAKLTASLLERLAQPTEEELSNLAAELNPILKRLKKRVYLRLDKFDDYYDKFYRQLDRGSNGTSQETKDRKAFLTSLLEGLVLAARDIKNYSEFALVDVLIAIPLDKFVELELREQMDLERRRVVSIFWSPKELFAFVNQRIHAALSLNVPVEQAWHEIFPKTVRNGATGQPEDSFLYVARHSLWKPREMQMHVYGLLKSMKENGNKTLDDRQIRESVKASCTQIIKQEFTVEFSKEYPGINRLLNQLENVKLKTVMSYSEVCDLISGIHLADDITAPDEVMKRLYKMGILGIRVVRPNEDKTPPTVMQDRNSISYRFHHNYPEASPFAPSSTVVFHPLFIERIAAKHEASYIIHELKWEMYGGKE